MSSGNRKQRRAAAHTSSNKDSTSTSFQPTSEVDSNTVDYILKHPDRSGPKGKTLFELAEERQRELDAQNPKKYDITTNNTPAGERPFNDEDPIGPLGNAILYSISLATLHLTLDVIVYTQYREAVIWSEILKRAATALPIFWLMVYLFHVDFTKRFPMCRNVFFWVVSVVAGCYMVYSGNMHGYFYVMKAAPPIGAVWVWSVVEMDLWFAAASCVGVLGYVWWNGFSTF